MDIVVMDIASTAHEITDDLRVLGKGARQAHRPSAQSEFGVYAPDFYRVAKGYKKRLKLESDQDMYGLAIALLTKNITECRHMAYALLAGHPSAAKSLSADQLEALGDRIDNWACVDTYCCSLIGPAWRRGQISDDTILGWAQSNDFWWRRAAVVATVPLNLRSRGGTGDTKRTLMMCDMLKSDAEDMVQKAISWALRELVVWDREAVEHFINKYEEILSARVKREVQKKLTTGKKN